MDDTQEFLKKIRESHHLAKDQAKREKIAAREEAEFQKNSLAQERIAICKSCDFYNQTLRLCNDCKCFMPAKTMIKWSKCPKGKW